MRKYLFIASIITVFFLAQSNTKSKILYSTHDDLWSGNISFSQIIYDTVHGVYYCGWNNDTSWSEWRMEASVINNKGTTKSSSNGWKRGNGYDSCVNAWGAIKDTSYATGTATAELELDTDGKEYGFTIDIPSCSGKHISKIYRNFVLENTIVEDAGQSESQIRVEQQKVGNNPNVLSGKIELHDRTHKGSDFVQIWKWNLKKVK